ncbi:MAG: hypothetical protein C4560_06250 [Nitrospiraceae bacterium]|nr:MAG: hypothetical protein C4560_06250 [Nitrospiraceae bacterium]
MSEVVLAEGIYVKRSKSQFGGRDTSRECVLETLWFPYRTGDNCVELFPVMDDLKRVLRITEKVPLDLFREEYSLKENSREIYLELKKTLPG